MFILRSAALLGLFVAPFMAAHASSASSDSVPPGGAAAWKLVWQDEFDGGDGDLDRHWHSQNGPSTHILSSRWRENVVIDRGTVRLVNAKEERGGQQWTSGNIWTREKFQYGYFEARYRYAAAEGTNNSFWLMNGGSAVPARGKKFEIDINEGHYPNEVNTNIHNWSDVTVVDGKRTNPRSPRVHVFGVRPDVTFQLEAPIRTRRVRFSSTHASHFHLGEFRIYAPNPAGYPADPFSATADSDVRGLVNHACAPSTRITVSGHYRNDGRTSAALIDGNPKATWISQKEGEKWVEFTFADTREIGCIQFLNGWDNKGTWTGLLDRYRLEYHDGARWRELTAFDTIGGQHDFARDFQTYGLEWTPDELVFYLNGKEIRREKNEFCHSPAPIYLSLAIIPWAGRVNDTIDGTFMEVDHVRVYQLK